MSFTETPGLARVSIKKKDRGGWGWFSHGSSRSPKVTVAVPARAAVEASAAGGGVSADGLQAGADLDSAGGSVEVKNHAGGLEAESSGGSVRVVKAVGDVRADSAGGSVEVQDVNGAVTLSSAGGSVRIERVTGKIKASASGGGVEAVLAPGNAAGGTIESAGGGIRVAIDPAVNLSLDASAAGGSVVTDLPVRMKGEASRNDLKGDLGQGGPLLSLEASGGGIRIEALPAR